MTFIPSFIPSINPLNRVIRTGIVGAIIADNAGLFDRKRPKGATPMAPDKPLPPPYVAPPPIDLSYNNVRGLFAIKDDISQHLRFQFNPEEITDTKDVSYEDKTKTGFDNADYLWVNGGSRTITFTLQLDASIGSLTRTAGKSGNSVPTAGDLFTHNPERGVYNQVEFLQSLQRPFERGQRSPRFFRGGAVPSQQFVTPPEVVFVYGSMYLEGIISSLDFTYSEFNRKLVPLKADANITFRVQEGRNVNIDARVTAFATGSPPPLVGQRF
jgi:hypothetical protein